MSITEEASLDAFAAEMKAQRADLNTRFDGVNARFDSVNARFEAVMAEMKLLHAEMRAELHQSLRNSQAVVLSAIGIATALLALITHYLH